MHTIVALMPTVMDSRYATLSWVLIPYRFHHVCGCGSSLSRISEEPQKIHLIRGCAICSDVHGIKIEFQLKEETGLASWARKNAKEIPKK